MRRPKTAYELRRSQVNTPPEIVAFFWRLVRKRRRILGSILDLGAGDCRFATGGLFTKYHGVEIDPRAAAQSRLPKDGSLHIECAFKHSGSNYDACIGNPPYVRHHDLELPWKHAAADRIGKQFSMRLDRHANLYLYFLCLALQKTAHNGLLALLIPFEWVSRPSASTIRKHIRLNRWDVSVYRFQAPIFEGVLTTASITIIDKKKPSGEWTFFDVEEDLTVKERRGTCNGKRAVLPYWGRSDRLWARRGISPGSQRIFTLTNRERLQAKLTREDVVPCVTSLRGVPGSLKQLTKRSFERYFVQGGRKCWLIRSRTGRLTKRVRAYLDTVPAMLRNNYTCLNQEPWYAYEWTPPPNLLFHCAFTSFGPKVLINCVGAQAVGGLYGVTVCNEISTRALQSALRKFRFEDRVVPHAAKLRKVEVRQLNTVLKRIDAGRKSNAQGTR
jgi:hypothetical protein